MDYKEKGQIGRIYVIPQDKIRTTKMFKAIEIIQQFILSLPFFLSPVDVQDQAPVAEPTAVLVEVEAPTPVAEPAPKTNIDRINSERVRITQETKGRLATQEEMQQFIALEWELTKELEAQQAQDEQTQYYDIAIVPQEVTVLDQPVVELTEVPAVVTVECLELPCPSIDHLLE